MNFPIISALILLPTIGSLFLIFSKSNDLLKLAHSYDPGLLKIGVGGVDDKDSFNAKFNLGASLVQIYTSFIYQGPKIVKKLLG